MAAKTGRPMIGDPVTVAVPLEHDRLLALLALRRKLDIRRRGTRPLLVRTVMAAGFEALRAKGEL